LNHPHELEMNTDEIYTRLFLRNGVVQMQLSRGLNPTLLPVSTADGDVHAFVYDRTRKGGEMVFQCSRCVSARAYDSGEVALVVVVEGCVSYERPNHQIGCHPFTKLEMIQEQLKRRIRLATQVRPFIILP
jgi:hypothetical protein